MLVEHDGQVLVDGQQPLERAGFQQFAGAVAAQQVTQRPVGIACTHQRLAHGELIHVVEALAAQIADGGERRSDFNTTMFMRRVIVTSSRR